MAITIRQLEIFERVAKCGHITQAGSQLMLTQSAVSMAIAELERLAGAPLFERLGKRLLLNDRGRQLLPEARELLIKARMIEQFLNDSIGEPKGVLNVGASTTIGNYILPAIIGEFSQRHPGAKASLHIGNAMQIENALENGELDLGLSEGIPHIGSLKVTPWKRDELVVIVGKTHEWAEAGNASLQMLKDAPWIMREKGSGTREIFETALARKVDSFSIALELGHTEAIKRAVEAGLGVGCLSRMAVQRELDHGWLVEIASELELQRTLILLTRNSEQQTTLFKAFIALLQQSNEY